MKVLVCIKQVPDMESKFNVNAAGTWFEESDLAYRLNEYDEFATEQAVQLKTQVGEADLTVLSVGPDRVKEALKKALAMGCDRAVHIKDDEVAQKSPLEIASLIADFAKDKEYDLIFTGMQSQDRGSAQVGIMLAEMLSVAATSTIVDFEYADGAITVKRELEGGLKSVVKLKTPALVTCQLGLNTPRYPTLPNIMKAKRKEMLDISLSDLAKAVAPQATASVYFPEKKGGGIVLEGDLNEMADKAIQIIKEKTPVL